MGRFERFLYLLFPTLELSSTPWLGMWIQREQRKVLLATRWTLAVGAVAYVMHYFLVDRPLGLTADARWGWYRIGMAGLAVLGLGATLLPAVTRTWAARAPLGLFGLASGVSQAWSMTWYPGVPYPYAFVIPGLIALLAGTTPLKSALWLLLVFFLQLPAFVRTAVEPQLLWSALVVSLVVVTALRSRMGMEITSFLAEQERLEAQRKLIESELALSHELQAFLPREVYARMAGEMRLHGRTVLEAMHEGLRPRLKPVACLFSDIRGFTQRSRDVDGFLAQGALPNIRDCTDIVEAHRGIPRLIGDLIFAYFDGDSPEENLANALNSGLALAQHTAQWNQTQLPQNRVTRHVLISVGECLVGNIGGFDSSREITALGSAVNILSRIDPLTKESALRELLQPNMLILTQSAARAAQSSEPPLQLVQVDLKRLGLTIRDFPEESFIWLASLPSLPADSVADSSATRSTYSRSTPA